MQEESQVADYITARRVALKRRVRELRDRAGITQEEVATFLACSRARIVEVEKEDSPSEYSVSEIELLAALLGRNPLDILRMSGQETIDMGRIVTDLRTGEALLSSVDCKLPNRIVKLFAQTGDAPGAIEFSPDGEMIASIVDVYQGEGLTEEDPPYRLTVLCWQARSGKLIGQIRLPDVEEIVPLDTGRVVLFTYSPFPAHQQTLAHRGAAHLLVWNTRSGEMEQEIPLPERVQAAAVSPDSRLMVAYFASTTSIQVWQTTDWALVSAFELLFLADHRSPGDRLDTAVDVILLDTTFWGGIRACVLLDSGLQRDPSCPRFDVDEFR